MITLFIFGAIFFLLFLGVKFLRKHTRVSLIFCCALYFALSVATISIASVWHWVPYAYRPVLTVEVLREPDSNASEEVVWLRNIFSVMGDSSWPAGATMLDGHWLEQEDGWRWFAQPDNPAQADTVVFSLPPIERYALFINGNRQSGKIHVRYAGNPDGEVIDAYRDTDAWELFITDIKLDGMPYYRQAQMACWLATVGCLAISVLLGFLSYRAMRPRRARLSVLWQSFTERLEKTLQKGPFAKPLNGRRWGLFACLGFFITLLPLLYIAQYALPCLDDLTFGNTIKAIWQQTGSIWKVLEQAFLFAKGHYFGWQGSFVAVFIMTLQPGIFGDAFYVVTPILLITSVIASTWFFCRTMLGKQASGVVCWLTLFLSIQYVYDISDSLFWYNGAIYYTFFYAISLVMFALLHKAHLAGTPGKRTVYMVFVCFLSACIGGSNLVSALLSCVLLTMLTGLRCLQKDRRWRLPALALLCMGICLVINMVAPGNAVRQAANRPPMPYGQAILTSFAQSITYLRDIFRWEYVWGMIILLPFLYRHAEQQKFSFKYPPIFTLLTFCAYTCQFTPHLRAFSVLGPSRLMAVVFYATFWFFIGNVYYWCGWYAKRQDARPTMRIFARWGAAIAVLLLAATCARTALQNPNAVNSASVINDYANGTLQRYVIAIKERSAIMEDPSQQIITLKQLPKRPNALENVDLLPEYIDPNETRRLRHEAFLREINAAYYGKTSISISREIGR